MGYRGSSAGCPEHAFTSRVSAGSRARIRVACGSGSRARTLGSPDAAVRAAACPLETRAPRCKGLIDESLIKGAWPLYLLSDSGAPFA